MELTRVSRRTVVGFASALLVVALAMTLLPARHASASHGNCTMSVSGPFFYAGMVFPVIEVTCDSVKQSIRIDASLDMDGTEVATSSRTCRKVSSCITGLAQDGIFAQDVPGDQLWCGHGSASIHSKGKTHVIPEATSCESDSF